MRLFFIAFQFLTIIPLPFQVRCEERDLGRSMAIFPLVGLSIGGMLALADVILSAILPRQVSDLLLIALLTIVTGALHLDGLADVFDGLAARGGRERMLAAMKDSHIGAAGGVALLLGVLLKYQALLHLNHGVKFQGLLLFPAVARFSQVLMATGAASARNSGLGATFMAGAGAAGLLAALGTTLIISVLCFSWKGCLIVSGASVLTLFLRWCFQNRLGGITGDIIGCGSELAEISVLLLIIALCDRM